MAGVTGLAVVTITADAFMLIVHFIFIVLMAFDTGKLIVIGRGVAVGAIEPGVFA